jgi:hypothetical protein
MQLFCNFLKMKNSEKAYNGLINIYIYIYVCVCIAGN